MVHLHSVSDAYSASSAVNSAWIQELRLFLMGRFNEDFAADGCFNAREVIDGYIARNKDPHKFARAAVLISWYVAVHTVDELEDLLYSELCCNYDPSLDGLSAHDWMLSIANQLRAACEGQDLFHGLPLCHSPDNRSAPS